jgi:hypothetical protein
MEPHSEAETPRFALDGGSRSNSRTRAGHPDDPATPKMSFFTLLGRPRARRPRVLASDRLAVYGRIQSGPLVLASADLKKMPAENRTLDVSAFAARESGAALCLKAICELARPVPGTLYVNFENRSGGRRVSHFLAEVQELGWIVYPTGDEVGPRGDGGSFRLVLPGMPVEQGRMNDLAWIEFSDESAGSAIPAPRRRVPADDTSP